MSQYIPNWKRNTLTPQARMILQHMEKAGSISARDAMNDYGITSAALSRRICDMEELGITINRVKREHPITGKKFTRYALAV